MKTASGHGHAVALRDYDGAVQVVGDEPNLHRGAVRARQAGKGFEGGAAAPSPEFNVQH